jgi:hypothetical protein
MFLYPGNTFIEEELPNLDETYKNPAVNVIFLGAILPNFESAVA